MLKQHTTTTGGNFTANIEKALQLGSDELIKANNTDGASYRKPIVAQALRTVDAIRKEVNERRTIAGEPKVSQNYIIDKLACDDDEQVELTDERLDDFATSVKRFLGVRGFVSLPEARAGLDLCLMHHLDNLRTVENRKGDMIFSDESFANTFANQLQDAVEIAQ